MSGQNKGVRDKSQGVGTMSKLVGVCPRGYVQGVFHRGRGKTVSLLIIEALGRFEVWSNGPSLKKLDSNADSREEIS